MKRWWTAIVTGAYGASQPRVNTIQGNDQPYTLVIGGNEAPRELSDYFKDYRVVRAQGGSDGHSSFIVLSPKKPNYDAAPGYSNQNILIFSTDGHNFLRMPGYFFEAEWSPHTDENGNNDIFVAAYNELGSNGYPIATHLSLFRKGVNGSWYVAADKIDPRAHIGPSYTSFNDDGSIKFQDASGYWSPDGLTFTAIGFQRTNFFKDGDPDVRLTIAENS